MRRLKTYRSWSIRTKLLLFSALLVMLSVSLVSLLSYLKYSSDFRRQSADQMQQTIEQASINIDNYIDDLFRLTLSPYRNNAVMDALEQNVSGSELQQLQKRRLLEDYLDEILIYPRRDILRVFILTDDIYWSARFPVTVDNSSRFKTFPWYQKALTTKQAIFIPVTQQQLVTNDRAEVFSIAKQLRSLRDTSRILGVIKVDANYKEIKDICEKVNVGREGRLFIIDNQKQTIYSSSTDPDDLRENQRLDLSRASYTTTDRQHRTILVNTAKVPEAEWTIVAIHSAAELNRSSVQTRNTAFALAVVCSLLAVMVFAIFAKQFLKPLLQVVRLMKQVELNEKLDVRFTETYWDEIGFLGRSFNHLLDKISEMLETNTKLVKEIYESKLLQQEAQIQALQSQIRPHFLFNTLNMISLMMQSNQQEAAVLHLHQLSLLFRGMVWDKEVPLRQELELLEAYLGIQRSRYEGRLEYSMDIAPKLLDCPVPSLLFQPIVENAVIHGCEKKRGKTMISIRSVMTADHILFIFEDNGKGMSSMILETLRHKLADSIQGRNAADTKAPTSSVALSSGTGIGLINIHKRLQMTYGPEYGLRIYSVEGQGTSVQMLLPPTLHVKKDDKR